MKKYRINALLLIAVLACIHSSINAQYICRGHSQNDLYFSGQTGYGETSMFRSIDNGSTISVVNSYVMQPDTVPVCHLTMPVAEKEEGFLYCLDRPTVSPWLFTSNDYGSDWTPNFNSPAGSFFIAGGEKPGDLYIQTRWADPTLYYSNDYGQTFTPTHNAEFFWIEVGTEPNELWALSGDANNYWLLYSVTNGSSFDTIPVNTSIMGNGGASFCQFSRGTQAGEIFIATSRYAGVPGFDSIKLYRSVDYAQSFELVYSELKSLEQTFNFTAGRTPCSLYIIRTLFGLSNITYWIEYSSDCGATFTTYEHLITGLPDLNKDGVQTLKSCPNPFVTNTRLDLTLKEPGILQLNIYSLAGECILTPINQVTQPGTYSYTVNMDKLSSGIYMGILKLNGQVIGRQKLIKR